MFLINYQKMKKKKTTNLSMYICKRFLSFLVFSIFIFSTSCNNELKFLDGNPKNNPITIIHERPPEEETDSNSFNLSKLTIHLDNFLLNETSPIVRVEGLVDEASLKLREGSCEGEVVSTLNQDGTFEELHSYDDYTEIQYYIELNYKEKTECKAL